MVRILAEGENAHRLEDSNGTILGMIRGRAIRFVGLASEHAAVSTALDIYPVMDDALARQFPGWKRHELRRDTIAIVHDGAYQWISDGRNPVARLFRPRGRGNADGFGIEFVLPSFSKEGVVISIAQLMARAYESSRALVLGLDRSS